MVTTPGDRPPSELEQLAAEHLAEAVQAVQAIRKGEKPPNPRHDFLYTYGE
jgi:hypothetical protein